MRLYDPVANVWSYQGTFYCPFCEHEWEAVGRTTCEPAVYIAQCPECLMWGYPKEGA